MKVTPFLILIFYFLMANSALGQRLKPHSVSVAYFGEMITHPGLKISANYSLKTWDKIKVKKSNVEVDKTHSIYLSPSLLFFYHKRYQTGLSSTINLNYHSIRNQKSCFGTGIGVGYLRTFIPNTYTYSESESLQKTIAGHNAFCCNVFLSWSRKINSSGKMPLELYIKPQYWMAFPNFPNTVSYFMLEMGLTIDLKKSEK